jgi:hypothetical protein
MMARLVSRLTCAAGLAARRFARATPRSQPRGRQSWRAVMLRWRRARPALAGTGPERQRANFAGVVWQPQWHLHFIEQATHRGNRARAGRAPSFTTLRELRTTFVDRERRASGNSTRSYERTAPRLRGRQAPDQRDAKAGARRSMVGVASEIVFTRAAGPSRLSPLGRTIAANPRLVSDDERRPVRLGAVREFAALERRRPVGEQSAAFVTARRTTLAPLVAWRSADATLASRARVAPSAQMSWRAAQASPSGDVEVFGPTRAARSAPEEPSAVDNARVMASSPQAPNASLPVQMKDLDPRVIDRLTDDVIRRVERRARIERERRGV